jgi:hypothetical protein
MADTGLVKMSDQFAGLPMSDLIGGPLQAACDAQVMLAKATADFIQDVGLEQDDATKAWSTRTVDFTFDRPVADTSGGSTTETVNLKVPLLAIINTPCLSVKEATVNFTMSVSSSISEEEDSDSAGSYSGSAVMDGIRLAEHLLKSIQERRDRISEMMSAGTVASYEEYKQLVGNVESLDYIGQELREILEKAD